MDSSGDESIPCPRLCHLIKWPDFDGYGFNLHAEKSKTGQYIGKVDDDSPAQLAGLREGDRIIEVNLVNISNENHRQVVERIKSVPNETKLLVLDELADKWYKEKKIVVKSSQSNVIHCKTPVPRPLNRSSPPTPTINRDNVNGDNLNGDNVNGDKDHENDHKINDNINNSNGIEPNVQINHKTNGTINEREESPVLENGVSSSRSSTPQSLSRSQVTNTESMPNNRPSSGGSNTNTSIPGSPTSSKSGSSLSAPSRQISESGADLNLNMSASEMRQILAQRKKHDAKKAQIDLKQKYEIIQQM
jgi:Na(+)/H(+) exchange regulatory cofactor NHE-RF2